MHCGLVSKNTYTCIYVYRNTCVCLRTHMYVFVKNSPDPGIVLDLVLFSFTGAGERAVTSQVQPPALIFLPQLKFLLSSSFVANNQFVAA